MVMSVLISLKACQHLGLQEAGMFRLCGSHYSPLRVVCVEADQDIRVMAKCKPDWVFD